MAIKTDPTKPIPPITPYMVQCARRALGACAQFDDYCEAYKLAGREFPEECQVNEMIKTKMQALIAAAEMYYGNNLEEINGREV